MKYASLPGGGQIPRLGLGTWQMGGDMSPDRSQDAQALRAIHTALDLGYRHIDTAEMYAGGHTEELVGKAAAGVDREELFITSKVWHSHLGYRQVRQALEGSLRRLKMAYLDLYLIHWPNERTPLKETFRALNELVEAGKVRYIGVSNFDLDRLRHAHELAEAGLATNQVPYSLATRQYARNGVLEYCQEHGLVLTAYSPIEKGSVLDNPTVKQVAEELHATPAQVALAWLLRQEGVIAIPKASSEDHLRDNLGALDLKLPEDAAQRLEST